MVHYRQTIELQEKHHAQGSPQMPSERARERREREGSGESQRGERIPALSTERRRRMDKNTLSVDLKRRLMAAMKKEMCF